MTNKNKTIIIKYLVSPIVLGILIFALYHQLIQQSNLAQKWSELHVIWKSPLLWSTLLLMFVNWGLESYKWKLLIEPLEEITFFRAFLSVLSGCSITLLTPNRTGEFAGRIVWLKSENRIKGISSAFVGSLSQLTVTFIAGTFGCYVMFFLFAFDGFFYNHPYIRISLLFLLLVLDLFLLLIYFNTKLIIPVLKAMRVPEKWINYTEVLKDYNRKYLLKILLISTIRYFVFIFQYVLILILMLDNQPLSEMWILTMVFLLLMTLLPALGLFDLPIRTGTGLLVFGLISDNVLGIQLTAFVIWLINFIIPTCFGALLLSYSLSNIRRYES